MLLHSHGIDVSGQVDRNPPTSLLYTHALRRGDGRLAEGGPLVFDTGKFTGRSPKDKFLVDEPSSTDRIWWGEVNQKLAGTSFTRTSTAIILHPGKTELLVLGTFYAGEIKKSIFTVMNDRLPLEGVFPMHCSANVDDNGNVAVFFGLSGTGKTTLSADPERHLIGDDEHGWGTNGVFNIEGGCYAKVIQLSSAAGPEIYKTTHTFGTILENVAVDELGRLDLDDDSKTENTRAAYKLEEIGNALPTKRAGHPSSVVFLTADAFGILPPIARLTREQALYYFLSGFTAKLAGTEIGVAEPQPTFSTCFAQPFLPQPPSVYARMLGEKLDQHSATVWLVNTGWTGGPFGEGRRMPTRGCSLVSLRDRSSGAEALWRRPGPIPPAPSIADAGFGAASARSFLDAFVGGWFSMFPTAGWARERPDELMHGESPQAPWRVVRQTDTMLEAELELMRSPFRLRRTVELEGAVVRVIEEVENLSERPAEYAWGQHPCFARATFAGGAISVAARASVPTPPALAAASRLPAGELEWPDGFASCVPVVPDGRHEHVCLEPREGRALLTAPRFERALELVWELERFPYVLLWQDYGAGRLPASVAIDTFALEPATNPGRSAPDATATGALRTLAPGEHVRTVTSAAWKR